MKAVFENCVDDYEAYRPNYPAALYDYLIAVRGLEPDSTIADLGAGTGEGSARLAARPIDIDYARSCGRPSSARTTRGRV